MSKEYQVSDDDGEAFKKRGGGETRNPRASKEEEFDYLDALFTVQENYPRELKIIRRWPAGYDKSHPASLASTISRGIPQSKDERLDPYGWDAEWGELADGRLALRVRYMPANEDEVEPDIGRVRYKDEWPTTENQ